MSAKNGVALAALILASVISLGGTYLDSQISYCQEFREKLEREELLSGIDFLIIDRMQSRASDLREHISENHGEGANNQIDGLDETIREAPQKRSEALDQYTESRVNIETVDGACSSLDLPRSVAVTVEWIANLLAAVLIFFAGISVAGGIAGRKHRTRVVSDD